MYDFVSPKAIVVINASAVIESLKEVKLGKSEGIDGLAAEHFVYCHSSGSVHLALLLTCMLNHGHARHIYKNFDYSHFLKVWCNALYLLHK